MRKVKYLLGRLLLCFPVVRYKQFVYNFLGISSPLCSGGRISFFVGNPQVIGRYGNIVIHNNASLERGSFIVANERIEIGENTAIAYGVTILTGADPRTELRQLYPKKVAPVTIGRCCWIGARSVILPGVTIGEYSVVAAGSVVTHDVPPRTMVAGVPAVVKKHLDI